MMIVDVIGYRAKRSCRLGFILGRWNDGIQSECVHVLGGWLTAASRHDSTVLVERVVLYQDEESIYLSIFFYLYCLISSVDSFILKDTLYY